MLLSYYILPEFGDIFYVHLYLGIHILNTRDREKNTRVCAKLNIGKVT
jgi:hypothetical protein